MDTFTTSLPFWWRCSWWAWRWAAGGRCAAEPGSMFSGGICGFWQACKSSLAASPLLLYALLVQLGRVSSVGGQRAASEILFPALALVAGLLGGFQFLLASRAYFGDAPESGALARRALCPGPCRGLRRGVGAEHSADSCLRISAHGSAYGCGELSPGGDSGSGWTATKNAELWIEEASKATTRVERSKSPYAAFRRRLT